MEIFFDVILLASLNLQTVDWNTPFLSEEISNYISILLISLVCIFTLVVLLIYFKSPSLWTNSKFMDRCGTMFDDLDTWKMMRGERALLIWPIMFCARRVAFVLLVLRFNQTLWVQLAVQNFVSLLLCIYLQWYRPF